MWIPWSLRLTERSRRFVFAWHRFPRDPNTKTKKVGTGVFLESLPSQKLFGSLGFGSCLGGLGQSKSPDFYLQQLFDCPGRTSDFQGKTGRVLERGVDSLYLV